MKHIEKKASFLVKIMFLCGLGIFSLITVSCGKGKLISVLQIEKLFDMKYGNFEDDLNVFDLASVGSINTNIVMKDGFFYIANGESKKIMQMNSYGDLLTLFYNEEFNPRPSFVSASETAGATRKAVSYPFNEISNICVDSKKRLYAVEKVPAERREYDSERKISLVNVVLRFDENSNFIDYLGQEGSGGTPFPFIKNIFTSDKGELIVVCTVGSGYTVFWFSEEGSLLYKIPIEKINVPDMLSSGINDSFYSVDNIIPDYKTRTLYLKVDYFSSYVDESSRVQSGIDYASTYIYPLNAETGIYGDPLAIPSYQEEIAEGFSKIDYSIPFDFIGVTDNNWLFFMLSTEDGLNIQMVQADGSKILNRRLNLNRADCLYYTFDLDNSGIISILTVLKDKAEISWWRTDALIQSVIKN